GAIASHRRGALREEGDGLTARAASSLAFGTIAAMTDGREWLFHPRQSWQARRRHAELLREIDEYRRKRDPAENVESAPPTSEEIRLHAVWAAESYPLSFIDVLLDAVRRL